MSALAVSMAMVRGSLPSESCAPRSAPRFKNRQASLERIARFSQQFTLSGTFLPEAIITATQRWELPSVAKDGCVVEWAPAMAVCLVHIRPILEEKLTGQKRILHREVENGEREWHL